MPQIPFNDNEQTQNLPSNGGIPNVGNTQRILNSPNETQIAVDGIKGIVGPIAGLVNQKFQKDKDRDITADVAAGTARINGANQRFMIKMQNLDPDGADYSKSVEALQKDYDQEVDSYISGNAKDGVRNVRWPEAKDALGQVKNHYRFQLDEATKTFVLKQSMASTEKKIEAARTEIIANAGPDAEALTAALFADLRESGMSPDRARIQEEATLKAVSAKRAQDFELNLEANVDDLGEDWAIDQLKQEKAILRDDNGKYRHLSKPERDEIEIGFDDFEGQLKSSKADREKNAKKEYEIDMQEARDEVVGQAWSDLLSGKTYSLQQIRDMARKPDNTVDKDIAKEIYDTQKAIINGRYQEAEQAKRLRDNPDSGPTPEELAKEQASVDTTLEIADMMTKARAGDNAPIQKLRKAYRERVIDRQTYNRYESFWNGEVSKRDQDQLKRITSTLEGFDKLYYLTDDGSGYAEDYKNANKVLGKDPDKRLALIGSEKVTPTEKGAILSAFVDYVSTNPNLSTGELEEFTNELIFPTQARMAQMGINERIAELLFIKDVNSTGTDNMEADLEGLY